MNKVSLIISISFLVSCGKSRNEKKDYLDQDLRIDSLKEFRKESKEVKVVSPPKECNYLDYYKDKGNQIVDTVKIKGRIIDPIDDKVNFKKARFDFFIKENRVYKKARTHRFCNNQFIDIEFYQDVNDRIDLNTYKEYDKRFFSTKNTVNFWWANSEGHLIISVNEADPKTFKPSESFCGGFDKNGVLYGSPNWGVYRLNLPNNENYELIPKKNNYWNTPEHYLVSNGKVYDIKFDSQKKERYYCELNNEVAVTEVMKLKQKK